ncbi:MAG TPA: DUF1365 domain-containing protein [Ramlibacter sp.]|jgi:DUF1365 family protein|uniref:DUF1365 domain-containing protein n=1 Tax=Ramlibacter sp. TaxID=1917967 RepID=UPI002D4382D2|nr:DUF1365 domain-containing protein [Ramlibacter sp.]HZY17126.1 DUF1365 domain-containing protein [Ramlibacter sp.]
MNQPQLGFGQVRHARLRPARHAFAYPTFFLLLPMRSLHGGAAAGSPLPHNRPGALSFWDRDHGDGRADALEWLDELLRAEGIDDADGEAWLHCYPRVLGYTFKPVSFWYCHRRDGSLRAIVVEVNNTFGERHCYLLTAPAFGRELQAAKVFHVSPFCRIEGRYRFRFLFTPGRDRTVVRIDHDDAEGPLLLTSVSGRLEPVTAAALRKALWGHPLMTLALVGRIHWQALRLALKGVPFFSKPAAPADFVTRP